MNPDVLKERYELLCEKNSDMGPFLPTLHDGVLNYGRLRSWPILIVELGVRYGASTIAFLHALESKVNGQLWSVDCSFPATDVETGVDLLNPQGPLGVVDYWTFILGYDTWWAVLEALPQENIDILLIDTNHVYEETMIELETYYPRMRKGGIIYLHDVLLEETANATEPQPPFPVRTAMREFCSNHGLSKAGLEWEIYPPWPGMGVIRVV